MVKFAKKLQVFALIFLLSAFIVAAISPAIVKAQSTASITIVTSVGGTVATDPADTTALADGTSVSLTATAGTGFVFSYWTIVTEAGGVQDNDNPTTLTVAGGTAYAVEAVFAAIQTPPGGTAVLSSQLSTAAIVVVLTTVGGTVSPAPGTYALANAASLKLQATPASGFEFVAWVIGGTPLNHGAYSFTDTPTDNPYTVDHGYGNTYTYQAVFKPVGSTIPEYSPVAIGALISALALVLIGTFAIKRKK